MRDVLHALTSVFVAVAVLSAWSLPASNVMADQLNVSACGISVESTAPCCCSAPDEQPVETCGCEMGSTPEHPPIDGTVAQVEVGPSSERKAQDISYVIVGDAGLSVTTASQHSSLLTLLNKAQPPPLQAVLCTYLY